MNKPYVKVYKEGELQNPIDKSYVHYSANRKARRRGPEDKLVLDHIQHEFDKEGLSKRIKHYSPTFVTSKK